MQEQRIVVPSAPPKGDRILAKRPVEPLVALGREIFAGIAMTGDRASDRIMKPLQLGDGVGIDARQGIAPIEDQDIAAPGRLLGPKG